MVATAIWWMVTTILMITGYSSTATTGAPYIAGLSNQDVLLPCSHSYNGAFRLEDLAVKWQRYENNHVVHGFSEGANEPWNINSEFMGRTLLFPQEFAKGNVSLLLRRVRASDAGVYACYFILKGLEAHPPRLVELQVHGLSQNRHATEPPTEQTRDNQEIKKKLVEPETEVGKSPEIQWMALFFLFFCSVLLLVGANLNNQNLRMHGVRYKDS